MHSWRFALLLLFAVGASACSGLTVAGQNLPLSDGGKLKDEPRPPSPEEDPKAPGMIPQECEVLLNKSQEWGNARAGDWKPSSPAQAAEMLRYFASFHLVPAATDRFLRSWLQNSPPASELDARKSLDQLERAQTCDLLLSHQMLLGLLKFRWAPKDREEASQNFLRFVLNQQARTLPAMARAVQLNVLAKAVAGKFVRADRVTVTKLQRAFDQETAKSLKRAEDLKNALEEWKLRRDELHAAEEVRERLGRVLPLP